MRGTGGSECLDLLRVRLFGDGRAPVARGRVGVSDSGGKSPSTMSQSKIITRQIRRGYMVPVR